MIHEHMTAETLVVPRAALDIEEPWTMPGACTPVRLRCSTDASAPRLSTNLVVWFDDAHLFILFSAADDYVQSTHLTHDAPLYEEDVVEAFLSPETPLRYYELEASPRGTLFDARIESPAGVRSGMIVDRDWTCEGLVAAVRRVTESSGTTTVDTLLRVPFAALGRVTPVPGETWKGNFFRIDRHPTRGDEYSAWQPTLKTPADFHVVASFGTLRFE
jgi:hypothetical protein